MGKETLEEAAKEYGMDTYPSIKIEDYTHIMKLDYAKLATAFKYGAKWQMERSYNDEDMYEYAIYYKNSLINTPLNILPPKDWFEQYKQI